MTHQMHQRAVRLAFALIVAAGSLAGVMAQTPSRPRFEVASVKTNKSGAQGVRMQALPGGRFVATNVTLRQLVREAYKLQNFQIAGGPSWITADTFDIVAKAADGVVPDADPFGPPAVAGPMSQLMQSLLEDRFKLRVRHESREMPIYALRLARSDGRLGSQIRKTAGNCSAELSSGAPRSGNPAPRPICGISMGPGMMAANTVTMAQLASVLPLGRTVADKTGLTGAFDFELRWTPETGGAGSDKGPAGGLPATVDPNSGSIFTAVQEQLGLTLDSQQGPVEVVVIESVERPTED